MMEYTAMRGLTHLDEKGSLRMVDVTEKPVTEREALAKGEIKIKRETIRLILDRKMPKGNVLEAARLAGIMAAKRTGDLIPLCHPLNITGVEIDFNVQEEKIEVESKVRIPGQTGVEMEALTATSMALLTIYDMCKAVDKEMVISNIRLIKKTGGRSGNDKSRNPNDKR